MAYPGCDHAGPCERPLQAKMSIPVLRRRRPAHGDLKEQRFHVLDDPTVARLSAVSALETGPALTAAFPARQGAWVKVRLSSGEVLTASLRRRNPGHARADPSGPAGQRRRGAGSGPRRRGSPNSIDRLEGEADALRPSRRRPFRPAAVRGRASQGEFTHEQGAVRPGHGHPPRRARRRICRQGPWPPPTPSTCRCRS
ncbi:MAG: hypothetical protein WDN45_16010 [Caulobacteraceae bacterium]